MCNNDLAIGTTKLNGFIVIRLDCTSLPTSKDFFHSAVTEKARLRKVYNATEMFVERKYKNMERNKKDSICCSTENQSFFFYFTIKYSVTVERRIQKEALKINQ